MRVSTKQLVIGGALLLLASLFFVVAASHKNSQSKTIIKATNQTKVVVLDNQSELKPYASTQMISDIQNSLYKAVAVNTVNKASSYTGAIRQWSFRLVTTNNTPVVAFLVDIASLKQTYAVSIYGSEGSDLYAAYITCPESSQVIYGVSNCQEVD